MNTYARHVSSDPFLGMDANNTSHSVKMVGFRRNPNGGLPLVLMVHTYERPKRPEAWGFPGGSQKPFEAYKETGIRELRDEAGIVSHPDAFPEIWSRPFTPIKSDKTRERENGIKFHQPHWYFGFLTDDMGDVPITETDEVIERGFFRLDKIPLPDYSRKNGVPSLLSHIQKLELVLMYIEDKVEDADSWLDVVRKRFGYYLRRYNNG